MKKVAIFAVSLLSTLSLSIAQVQVAVPTLYTGDVDPGESSECVALAYNLRVGSRDVSTDGEVSLLQDFLYAQGYLLTEADGYFNDGRNTATETRLKRPVNNTLKAVKDFQTAIGLTNSGYVGPQTRAKIKAMTCGGETTTPVANPGATGSGGRGVGDTGGGTTRSSFSVTVTNPNLPVGCTATTRFSSITGESCVTSRSMETAPGSYPQMSQFTVTPNTATTALEVKASFYLGSACSNYTLDWGDGTNSNFTMPSDIACTQMVPTEPFVKMHTYAKAGTYTVKFQTGGNPQYSVPVTVGVTTQYPPLPTVGGPVISSVQGYKVATIGTVYAGEQAVIKGTGLKGKVSVKITGPMGDQVVSASTVSDSELEFTVPSFTSFNTRGIKTENILISVVDPYGRISNTVSVQLVIPTTPITGDVVFSLAGAPKLFVDYILGATGGEAALTAEFMVNVKAGSQSVSIGKTSSAGAFFQGAQNFYVTLFQRELGGTFLQAPVGGMRPIQVTPQSSVQETGDTFIVQPGQSVNFKVVYAWNPKQLFEGSYKARLTVLDRGQIIGETSEKFPTYVTGEVSPYISGVTVGADGVVQITGKRFLIPGNMLMVDGTRAIDIKGVDESIGFSSKGAGLAPGTHFIQIMNSSKGNSNNFSFVVPSGVGSTEASATVVGFPKLALAYAYGSTGGEASLGATYTVTVKAGNSPLTINNSNGGLNRFAFVLNSTNGQVNSLIGQEGLTLSVDGITISSPYTISQGQTATFTVRQSWNPKLLFAGAYYAKLYLYDENGRNLITDGPTTNAVTVTGEVSPYISSVTVGNDGVVQVTGQRFSLSGNMMMVDGVNAIQMKGTDTETGFSSQGVGLASGGHFLQIKNSQKGDSNSFYFVVNNVVTPVPVTPITPVSAPSVSATANAISVVRQNTKAELFNVTVNNLTSTSPVTAVVMTLDAPGSGVFKEIQVLENDQVIATKSGLAGYLKFDIPATTSIPTSRRFSVVAVMEPAIASFYTTMQVQAVFDAVIVGTQTLTPVGGRVFGQKMNVSQAAPGAQNTGFNVLASSVKKLEQIYTLSSTGGAGTIALSAPTTLTTVTEELINFTGLKRGANEVRVSRLKAILRTISPSVSVGCANLSIANTLYGPTTEECVKIFQNLNELEPTGYINEATNKALNSVIGR
jgi:peptidoglycan hydrolase-like protein with peptidoglycan-binding domain